MASYLIFVVIAQILVIQSVHSQCVNRVVNSCGQNIYPLEALLSNQVLITQPGLPLAVPQAYPYVPSFATEYAPTVIQDSSVANNLANALQLLVVSNLLSSTLPGADPYYMVDPYQPYGPYNNIY